MIGDELVGSSAASAGTRRTARLRGRQWLESYDGGPQRIDRIMRGHVYVPNWSLVDRRQHPATPARRHGKRSDRRRPVPAIPDDPRQARRHGRGRRSPARRSTSAATIATLHGALAALQPRVGAEGKPMPGYFDDDAQAVRRSFMPLIERLQVDPTLPTIIRETAPKWSGLLARLGLDVPPGRARRARAWTATVARPPSFAASPAQLSPWRRTSCAASRCRTCSGSASRPCPRKARRQRMPVGWPATSSPTRPRPITAREIGRAYRPLRGKPLEIDEAMAVLIDAGWASSSRRPARRRPLGHQSRRACPLRRCRRRRAVAAADGVQRHSHGSDRPMTAPNVPNVTCACERERKRELPLPLQSPAHVTIGTVGSAGDQLEREVAP